MANSLKITGPQTPYGQSVKNVEISQYALALIKTWQEGKEKPIISPNRISVSQTVSFAAFLYEKMRNAVEFREEHLIRRAAIERILKRRILLNENGRDVAESLIKELLWARYYENNTISEEKASTVQNSIDKYFFIRNEIASGRSNRKQEKINEFILEVLSSEIEEILSPNFRQEAFTNYAYQIIRSKIAPFEKGKEQERDIQVYISIERTFAKNDDAIIRYHLLKLYIPDIEKITWKLADKILPSFYEAYLNIEKQLVHPFADRLRNVIRKQIPPFLILRDIFEQNPETIKQVLENEKLLKDKVDQACRKRYQQTSERLKRTGIRSFIYILLTKAVFAFLVEIPYDLYFIGELEYIPIAINVVFPPLLMAVIVLSVTVPGDDNTRRIYNLINGIIIIEPDKEEKKHEVINLGRTSKKRGPLSTTLFTLIYFLTYVFSFGTIVYFLSKLDFNPVSQGVFIFFVTLVTFFGFRVTQITREYMVVDRDSVLSPLVDFFFLPIIRVGQWLSGEVLQRLNILIFILDFIIEMPFKAIVEVVDEWISFVKIKKEEIV